MLPPRHRLRHRAEVLRVRQLGQPVRHPLAILLVVRAQPRPVTAMSGEVSAAPPTRFAFTASRRVGTAVARNRSKRLLREAVRKQLQRIEPGWDCLMIARETAPAANFAEVETAVAQLLERACLLPRP